MTDVSHRASLIAAVHRMAAVRGDAPAITWIGRGGECSRRSYAALSRAVLSRRRELALQGLGSGAYPVGLVAANRIETIVTALALLDLGQCVVMLSPSDPGARRRAVVQAAEAARVLDPSAPAELVCAIAHPLEWAPAATEDADAAPAFVFPTSGSTASSKLVVQPVRAVRSNARAVARHHGLGPSVTVLGGLPLAHVNGFHFTVLGTLLAGAHLVLPEAVSVFNHLDLVSRYDVQIASMVPTLLDALIEFADHWTPPRRFRYFVSAAAPLHGRTARRVSERLGARVIQGYGLSETTNFSTTMPVDLNDDEYDRLVLCAENPSVGVAAFEQEVAVLDGTGQPVPDGTVGELCMRGEGLMSGYLGNPEETASAFRYGWFHSGDLGRAQTIGELTYFYLTGRIKNVAKVRGESVSLEEIERLALQVYGVVDAGCVALPDEFDNERIVLMLVGPEHLRDPVSDHFATMLPPLHRPASIRFVHAVPRTPTGKVLRPALAQLVVEP